MSQAMHPLTVEVFLEDPPGELPESSPEEIRRAVRFRPYTASPLRLLVQPSFSPLRGWVFNLSTEGIGLLLPGKIEPGSRIAVQLGMRSPAGPRVLLADVIHASPREDARWLIGCRLALRLDEEEVIALLDNPNA